MPDPRAAPASSWHVPNPGPGPPGACPRPAARPGSVPVKSLNLSRPEELPLSLQGQSLQPLPGRVHFVLLGLDGFLLGVLLLQGGEQRPAWVLSPQLLPVPASANLHLSEEILVFCVK